MTGQQSRESAVAIAELKTSVNDQRGDIIELKEEVRAMKRALWGLVLSLLSGMIIFLMAVAQGWIGGGT